MAGIHARSASGKLENNDKDLKHQHFVTGQKAGPHRRALDTFALGLYQVATDVVEAGSDNNLVILTAHAARPGDFLRIDSSANGIQEYEVPIDEVPSANSLRLGTVLSAALAAGDAVTILRPITPRLSSTGATLTTLDPSPINFRKDGAVQEVVEDTATPANNQPLPVKLMGVNGTLNLTANDLDISSSHTEDSIAIGDGVDLLAINADGSINIGSSSLPTGAATAARQDLQTTELQEIEADVEAMSAKLPATLGQKAMAASLAVVIASDQSAVPVSGPLTDAQLRATAVPVSGPLTDAQLRATAVPVSGPLTDTQLRATAVPVSISSSALPTGAATEAKQDTGNASLANIDTDLGAPADGAVSNPALSGSVIALLKGLLTLITSTNTKLDTLDVNTSSELSAFETLTAAAAATTMTAPAGARYMIIQNSTDAASSLRFTPASGTPTATSGFFLGQGQSTSQMPAGSVKVISTDGGAIDCTVLWFV